MYRHTHTSVITDLSAEQVWSVWSDVNRWSEWQDDIEFAKLDAPFEAGSTFKFRPKGGPTIDIELTQVSEKKCFTDLTRFPLARMLDSHELVERDGALEVRTTITLSGPLSFVWRKLVVDRIVSDLPQQTARLLQQARGG